MKKGIIVFLQFQQLDFQCLKKSLRVKIQNRKASTDSHQISNFLKNGRKQVPEGEAKIRKININDLKQRFFKERVEIYKKTPKSSLEIFKQFDVAFINFFNATSEKEQIRYSKQLNELVIKYNGMFSKPIPNEYFLCEEILNIFSVKNVKKTK